MARIVKVKNTGALKTWMGVAIASGTYYTIPETELDGWKADDVTFADVGTGRLVVNDGESDFSSSATGWSWLLGDKINVVQVDERRTSDGKLRVMASHKPTQQGKVFYNYFSSSGDDWSTGTVASGSQFRIQTSSGQSQSHVDLQYLNYSDPDFTKVVWLYGGAFGWENAGWGDSLSVEVRARASSVVPRAVATGIGLDVDYDLDGERIAYAGPDAGDYALGGYPIWVPNFDREGYWDLDTQNLTAIPNVSGTGEFDWYITEQFVGHYVANLVVYGSNYTVVLLESTESVALPFGHWLRIIANNDSDTEWKTWGFIKLYRETLK